MEMGRYRTTPLRPLRRTHTHTATNWIHQCKWIAWGVVRHCWLTCLCLTTGCYCADLLQHCGVLSSCTMEYGFHETVRFLPVRLSDCCIGKRNPAVIGFILWIYSPQKSLNVGAFCLCNFSHACQSDRAQRAQAGQDWIGSDYIGSVSSLDLDGLWTTTAMNNAFVKMCFEDKTGENLKW